MKAIETFLNQFTSIILLVVIAIGLVNVDYFFNQTTFAFYGFCISSLIFVITPSCLDLTNYKRFVYTKTTVVFALWVLYLLIQYSLGYATYYYSLYFVVLWLFFFKTSLVFGNSNCKPLTVFAGVSLLAVLESVYCMAQYFGVIATKNNFFTVTGTWTNPNVTAIFLALTIPAFLFLFQSSLKKLAQIGFVMVLFALVLLNCRAAYIGSAVSILIYYAIKYQFISWIKDKKNRVTLKTLLVISLLILISIGSKLYDAKKASAEGRMFIWKVATLMVIEKPITGYGYGYFSRDYNQYQSQYIQEGKATTNELQNVDIVNMPYNEILQQWVEGGIIGVALMVLFFATLLHTRKTHPKTIDKTVFTLQETNSDILYQISYAAVIAFIIMSMVNTTLIVTPVMGLLLLYAAILNSKQNPLQLGKITFQFRQNKTQRLVFATLLVPICSYLVYLFVFMAIADRQNKIASDFIAKGNYKQAQKLLTQLEPQLDVDSNYWQNRASLHFQLKEYSAAISCFKKASAINTEVDYHLGAAACYNKLNQPSDAIAQYQKLILLKPSKFSYRFELMKLHFLQKDTLNTIQTAKGIVDLKPKIPSPKVVYYKRIARKVIFNLDKNASSRTAKNTLKTTINHYDFLKNDAK